MTFLENVLNYIHNIITSETASAWSEAGATFLAVLVSLHSKHGVTIYITDDDDEFHYGPALHINNLYNNSDSIRLLKGVLYKNNKRIKEIKDLTPAQHIHTVQRSISIPLDRLVDTHKSNDLRNAIDNCKFDEKFNKSKKLNCHLIFKDNHHKHYILKYPSNIFKSYSPVSYMFIKHIYTRIKYRSRSKSN